jgi:hypothetical protein
VSWDQPFLDPIELPNARNLVTLRDAALYITKLPETAKAGTGSMTSVLYGDFPFSLSSVVFYVHRD